MSFMKSSPRSNSVTLRVLAHLLRYPSADVREHAQEMMDALEAEAALSSQRRKELTQLIQRLVSQPVLQLEAEYVETFDRGRQTSLYLFELVHGDSRDRGPAMIDLIQTYEQAGLYLSPSDLPDYLPVVLEYASTQPAAQARSFLGEVAHLAQAIFSALLKRNSPYASVLAAIIELAGEKASPVAIAQDEDLDESWAEPAAFDGCSTEGQNRPGQPQPIKIVRSVSRKSPSNQSGAQV